MSMAHFCLVIHSSFTRIHRAKRRAALACLEDLNMLRATADVVTFFELQGWAAGHAEGWRFLGVKSLVLTKGYPKS